ncbi:MAG: hypothetical protein WAZ18_05170 [Alphaproteobacteria bacterium]
MTTIHIHTTESTDPTQTFAHTAWKENPRLSPSSYRSAQGLTLSKLTYDARISLEHWPQAIASGCNIILLSATTAPNLTHKPEGTLAVLETLNPHTIPEGIDILLTPPNPDAYEPLEQAVKDGHILFYGLTCTGWEDINAHLIMAEAAAHTVWGRRKRPELKALMVPFNLAEQHAAREATTTHGTEPVSPLELAARRSMLVLADRPTLWHGPWGLCDVTDSTNPTALKAQALLTSRLPAAFNSLPTSVQSWMVATSMPGIASATASPQHCHLFQQALEQPDIPDIASILQTP